MRKSDRKRSKSTITNVGTSKPSPTATTKKSKLERSTKRNLWPFIWKLYQVCHVDENYPGYAHMDSIWIVEACHALNEIKSITAPIFNDVIDMMTKTLYNRNLLRILLRKLIFGPLACQRCDGAIPLAEVLLGKEQQHRKPNKKLCCNCSRNDSPVNRYENAVDAVSSSGWTPIETHYAYLIGPAIFVNATRMSNKFVVNQMKEAMMVQTAIENILMTPTPTPTSQTTQTTQIQPSHSEASGQSTNNDGHRCNVCGVWTLTSTLTHRCDDMLQLLKFSDTADVFLPSTSLLSSSSSSSLLSTLSSSSASSPSSSFRSAPNKQCVAHSHPNRSTTSHDQLNSQKLSLRNDHHPSDTTRSAATTMNPSTMNTSTMNTSMVNTPTINAPSGSMLFTHQRNSTTTPNPSTGPTTMSHLHGSHTSSSTIIIADANEHQPLNDKPDGDGDEDRERHLFEDVRVRVKHKGHYYNATIVGFDHDANTTDVKQPFSIRCDDGVQATVAGEELELLLDSDGHAQYNR